LTKLLSSTVVRFVSMVWRSAICGHGDARGDAETETETETMTITSARWRTSEESMLCAQCCCVFAIAADSRACRSAAEKGGSCTLKRRVSTAAEWCARVLYDPGVRRTGWLNSVIYRADQPSMASLPAAASFPVIRWTGRRETEPDRAAQPGLEGGRESTLDEIVAHTACNCPSLVCASAQRYHGTTAS
jgi:hypothetical protein